MMTGDKESPAVAIDISEGGMALLTNQAIPRKGTVALNFTMFDAGPGHPDGCRQTAKVQASVCYCIPVDDGKSYRLGLEYFDLSAGDRNFIAKFVSASK